MIDNLDYAEYQKQLANILPGPYPVQPAYPVTNNPIQDQEIELKQTDPVVVDVGVSDGDDSVGSDADGDDDGGVDDGDNAVAAGVDNGVAAGAAGVNNGVAAGVNNGVYAAGFDDGNCNDGCCADGNCDDDYCVDFDNDYESGDDILIDGCAGHQDCQDCECDRVCHVCQCRLWTGCQWHSLNLFLSSFLICSPWSKDRCCRGPGCIILWSLTFPIRLVMALFFFVLAIPMDFVITLAWFISCGWCCGTKFKKYRLAKKCQPSIVSAEKSCKNFWIVMLLTLVGGICIFFFFAVGGCNCSCDPL